MKVFCTLLFTFVFSSSVLAAQGHIVGKVQQVLTTSDNFYGQCMAKLDKNIATVPALSGCPADWVTFSCSGDFNTKAEGLGLYDQAKYAQALNRNITILVTDQFKHNGYCLGKHAYVSSN